MDKMTTKPSLKQAALLTYLGHTAPESLTRSEASTLIQEASDSLEHQGRLLSWATDRLVLHPELYRLEIEKNSDRKQKQKAERFKEICSYCNQEKEDYDFMDASYWPLKKLKLDQCKKAVAWLDEEFPGWDDALYEEFSLNDEIIESAFMLGLENVCPEAFRKNMEKQPRKRISKKEQKGCSIWAALAIGVFFAVLLFSLVIAPTIFTSPKKLPPATAAPTAPSPSPTPDPLVAGGKAKLSVEKSVKLAYGAVTLKAGSEVSIKSIAGDTITIEAAGQTLAIPRGELVK